jgi:hypothetical protein
MPKATVTIVLEYDLANLVYAYGEELAARDFREVVEEMTAEDLRTYIRECNLNEYALVNIDIEEDN